MARRLTFYEFFAGGGMARVGLGASWTCLFANDIDAGKARAYRANWGEGDFWLGDLAQAPFERLTGVADLAWASFPCQDLSLAGIGMGMGGATDEVKTRSGAFWLFHEKMQALRDAGRAPRLIVLENVLGVLTSHGKRDFAAIVEALAALGYRVGAVTMDARHFTPQSRPRVFFVAALQKVFDDLATGPSDDMRIGGAADPLWHSPALCAAQAALPDSAAEKWVWWRMPQPPLRRAVLSDLIEAEPKGVHWRDGAATTSLLALMNPAHRAKIAEIQASGQKRIGAVYRRTRRDEAGGKAQRAEVRFDGLAGCLRTPGGGSSRQTIVEVAGKNIRSRLLSPREAARLMGLPDSYILPEKTTEAYHLLGDGVCAPVVRYLAAQLLEPLALAGESGQLLAAE